MQTLFVEFLRGKNYFEICFMLLISKMYISINFYYQKPSSCSKYIWNFKVIKNTLKFSVLTWNRFFLLLFIIPKHKSFEILRLSSTFIKEQRIPLKLVLGAILYLHWVKSLVALCWTPHCHYEKKKSNKSAVP